MSEIFDIDELRAGDVIATPGATFLKRHEGKPGKPAVQETQLRQMGKGDQSHSRIMTIGYRSVECDGGRVTPSVTRIFMQADLRGHITRVSRPINGELVQIFPRPECPFKEGDTVRLKFGDWRDPWVVRKVEWVGEPLNNWKVWGAGQRTVLATSLEVVPPEPSIEDELHDLICRGPNHTAAIRKILDKFDVKRKGTHE